MGENSIMEKIIIYGNGDFAKQIYWYFKSDTSFDVVAFCADKKYISDKKIYGLKVYEFETIEKDFKIDSFKMFVAIGYGNMRAREHMFNKAKNKGYDLVSYVSSKAILSPNIKLGENNAILHGVIIEPNAQIGNNNIIWSSVVVCHDSKIGNHNFIAAGTIIGGFTRIEDLCFIGFNSTILQNLHILNESLIGAKSLQLSNTVNCSKWIGSPSKMVGYHQEGIKIS